MKEIEELENKINKTIKIFYKHDFFLIKKNVNERSMTHKLAEYLQLEFPEYHVDCEYNMMKKESNMNGEDYISKKLDLPKKETDSYDTKATTVYPDIIIHRRGNNKNNLLVIEAKKEKSDENKGEFDIIKINAYIDELGYKHGIFLKLYKNPNETLKRLDWYPKK